MDLKFIIIFTRKGRHVEMIFLQILIPKYFRITENFNYISLVV